MTLRQAIENLYAAFADVPRPQAIAACPCCMDEQEVQAVLKEPLRTLSAAQLSSYASSVLYTVGEWRDFQYFLPRLLELTSLGELIWPDPEIMLNRIQYGLQQGYTLTPHKASALSAFRRALWRDMLAQSPDTAPLATETVLAACLSGGSNLPELLKDWQSHPSPHAVWHAARFIKAWSNELALGKTLNHHLEHGGKQTAREIYQWTQKKEFAGWLESAFFADPDSAGAQDISDAMLYLGATS